MPNSRNIYVSYTPSNAGNGGLAGLQLCVDTNRDLCYWLYTNNGGTNDIRVDMRRWSNLSEVKKNYYNQDPGVPISNVPVGLKIWSTTPDYPNLTTIVLLVDGNEIARWRGHKQPDNSFVPEEGFNQIFAYAVGVNNGEFDNLDIKLGSELHFDDED